MPYILYHFLEEWVTSALNLQSVLQSAVLPFLVHVRRRGHDVEFEKETNLLRASLSFAIAIVVGLRGTYIMHCVA